jgi:glutamate carboxypeptidase
MSDLTNTVARLTDELRTLVECESPSADLEATASCADVVNALATARIGRAGERVVVDGRTHLRWDFGRPRVLLLGHLDTVWPLGTLERWPYSVDGDRATGPGAFDMKAGLVQMFEALSQLERLDGIGILVTSDEEIGSTSSAALIEDASSDAHAVLVLEPSAHGALKTARKGVGMFTVEVTGRAAHAGLEPENGINATVEVAHHVLEIAALGDSALGTSVTPSVLSAGTTVNTVPAGATLHVDVRAATVAEMQRVEAALQSLVPVLPGAEVKVHEVSVRAPFEPAMSAALFDRAREHAARLGLAELQGVAVGGGSDGNITAALGVPTLDGLGAVGDNAHAEGEWVSLSAMPERAALVAALVSELREATT